jgi:hypothetical protein
VTLRRTGSVGHAELKDIKSARSEVESLTGGLRKVDEDVSTLGWSEADESDVDGGGEKTLVGSNLNERLAIGEGKVEEAAIGGVDQAETVEAGFDLKVWANFTVDENAVGAELGDPWVFGIAGGVVEELAIGGEVAVIEEQRDFIFSGRQVEGILKLVAEKKHAEEAGVGVESIDAHGVVVIPKRGGFLFQRIVTSSALSGRKPVFGVAIVFGGNLRAVEVSDGANIWNIGAATVERVIDGKEMFGGEIVDPRYFERFTAASFDEWRESGGAVAPHAGHRYIAMNLRVDLLHGDSKGALAVAQGRTRELRNRERVDEGSQLKRVQHEGFAGGNWLLLTHLRLSHIHLSERARRAIKQTERGGLLKKLASG